MQILHNLFTLTEIVPDANVRQTPSCFVVTAKYTGFEIRAAATLGADNTKKFFGRDDPLFHLIAAPLRHCFEFGGTGNFIGRLICSDHLPDLRGYLEQLENPCPALGARVITEIAALPAV